MDKDQKFRKIKELFIFVNDDLAHNEEGICAVSSNGTWMPLVCSNPKILPVMKRIANQLSKEANKKITILKFSVREEIEVIDEGAAKN